jgi:hypothetical protein
VSSSPPGSVRPAEPTARGLLSEPAWEPVLGLLANLPALALVTVGRDHLLAYQNTESERILGPRPIGVPAADAFPDIPEWLTLLDDVLATGEPVTFHRAPMDIERDGRRQRLLLDGTYAPLRDPETSAVLGVYLSGVDVTAAQVAEEQSQHSALLARISTDLSRTLDLTEVARVITRLATDLLAGWCVLDVRESDGRMRRIAGTHRDPAMQPLIDRLLRFNPITGLARGEPENLAARVARTGRAVVGRFDTAALIAASTATEHAELLAGLDPGHYLIVPLQVGGRRLGALSLLRSAESPPFVPRDRALAGEIADRGALALGNARDYDEQRRAALTFQRRLLPSGLPQMPGASLAVRYEAGNSGAQVGGDWYDAIPLPGGALGVVLGDVEGHDLDAAALMGQVRSVVRAYAQEGHPPALVAERTNTFLCGLGGERLVTLIYAQLLPAEGIIVAVRAGHVPGLLQVPGEQPALFEAHPGLPLGVDTAATWRETTRQLPSSSLLALFTDGLVETPGLPLDEGLGRLRDTLAASPAADLELLADRIMAGALYEPDLRDDIALLLVRLAPDAVDVRGAEDVRVETVPPAGPGEPAVTRTVTRQLPATAGSARIARHFVTDLLPQWGLPGDVAETAALLVSEVVTNATQQTDRPVELRVATRMPGSAAGGGAGQVRVAVFDDSHRLPQLREVDLDDTSGRGLHLVDLLAARWGVDTEERGKSVWFELDVTGQDRAR